MGRDGVVGLLLLALSGWLYLHTRQIPRPPFVPLGPDFYPSLLLAIVAVLAVGLVIGDLRGRRRRGSSARGVSARAFGAIAAWARQHRAILWTYLLFGSYAALMPVLGFRASTTAFVALLTWVLGQRTARQIPIAVITGLATALLTHAVFETYLRILLPRGRLL